ncbi:BppU family phage baseplate upper protein, partial [Convivina intestini]|uniref:BppU family phage baseplate upper protein n=1 Tax=Convivina intestini TaxID=1505726 RepID=UPI00200C81D2
MPKYVELNTELSTNSATIVDALNGRQGDNNREVHLWIKNGQSNYDLTNKTVTLEVKDSAGVVKTASTMNDTSGITTGRFSLLIPGMFYQAPGPVMEAFIVIKANDNTTVLSTIPISFQVIENNIMITQSQSKLYLDGVQQVIDEFNSRFKGASQNLEAMTTAVKSLQDALDNVTAQINGKGLASKGDDNTFTGSNTFTNPIKGSL